MRAAEDKGIDAAREERGEIPRQHEVGDFVVEHRLFDEGD